LIFDRAVKVRCAPADSAQSLSIAADIHLLAGRRDRVPRMTQAADDTRESDVYLHFDVDGDDFWVDLLLFHVEQLRYVVVELKIGRFKPDYAGQLGFYVALVDDQPRRPDRHAPTVGILLCAGRNDRVVRYSLGGWCFSSPCLERIWIR
jgi:hypothetical protein